MYLHRVTPDAFENSKRETSAIGQEIDRLIVRNDMVVAKFDRFGSGSKRLSDFEVEMQWSDIETFIAEFSKANHPAATELQAAINLLGMLKASGWRAT